MHADRWEWVQGKEGLSLTHNNNGTGILMNHSIVTRFVCYCSLLVKYKISNFFQAQKGKRKEKPHIELSYRIPYASPLVISYNNNNNRRSCTPFLPSHCICSSKWRKFKFFFIYFFFLMILVISVSLCLSLSKHKVIYVY